MILTFISYSKKDKEAAKEIAIFLASENINVWFDEWKIDYGDSIVEKINNGLICTHFILVWSKNASQSKWVSRELNSTIPSIMSNESIKIIPVIIDDEPLPRVLKDLKYLRFNQHFEMVRWELIKTITGKNSTQNYIRSIVMKYKELIDGGSKGIKACPECGNSLNWDDGGWPNCPKCNWS